jgi:hypothetical protein
MARAQYMVVLHQGDWSISFNGQQYGPYKSQKEAIRAAITAAHGSGTKGAEAEVLLQGTNNKFLTEWTYGRDPYPPR